MQQHITKQVYGITDNNNSHESMVQINYRKVAILYVYLISMSPFIINFRKKLDYMFALNMPYSKCTSKKKKQKKN